MRRIGALGLVVCLFVMGGAMLAGAPAQADTVPPFKGNDTGGIIAYSLASQTDARQLAVGCTGGVQEQGCQQKALRVLV